MAKHERTPERKADDQKRKAIELAGIMYDAMTPKGRPWRTVSRSLGPDTAIVQIYDAAPGGGEVMVMEMVYRRASA